jgi:5-methylcytosine-specific restriction endonuclease McrA
VSEPIQQCSLCKQPFPATLVFFNKGGRKNGLYSACKPCQKDAADKWYQLHRAEHLVRTKAYAAAHPQVRRTSVRTYRLRHPERVKRQAAQTREKRRQEGKAGEDYLRRQQSGKSAIDTKRYRQIHPERVQLSQKTYNQNLKARGITRALQWKKNRPDQYLNHSRVQTITRQDMKRHGVTALGIYQRDGGKCHLCHHYVSRKSFTLDHIIPKSKGGPGSWENLALAHLRCNVKRGVDRVIAQYRLF